MASSAREAKLRITGDNRQALTALKQFDKGVTGTARGIRSLAAGLRTVGTLAGGFLAYDIITRQMEFDEALDRVATRLHLTGEEAAAFRAQMAGLNRTWVNMGHEAGELGGALFDSAAAIRALRGDGTAAQKVMTIFERAINLADTTGEDLGATVRSIIGVIKAYNMNAEDAGTVTDLLTTAWDAGGGTVAELSERVSKLAPAANAAGAPLKDVLTLVATVTSDYDPMIEKALLFNSKLREGDTDARKLADQIGLALDEGESPNVIDTFASLNQAMSNGVNIAPLLQAAIDQTISDDDVLRAKQYADELARAFDLQTKLDAARGALDAHRAAVDAQSDDSLVGSVVTGAASGRRNIATVGAGAVLGYGKFLLGYGGDLWHGLTNGVLPPSPNILPDVAAPPSGEIVAPRAPLVVGPDGRPYTVGGTTQGPLSPGIVVENININGAQVKDGDSFARSLNRTLEAERARVGSGRR